MPKKPAGTPAIAVLERAGIVYRLHEYEHDPRSQLGFGLEGATKLGIAPERIFKTLLASAEGQLVVGIVPVSGKLDLKALAAAVGKKKAGMADPDVAQKVTGYVVGGISPLGQKRALTTVIDESALVHPTVLVSGGRRGLDIELAPADLARLTDAQFARIGN